MSDRARDFLDELVEHWDDSYWWADHQILQAVLLVVLSGLLTIPFAYLEGRAKRAGLGGLSA